MSKSESKSESGSDHGDEESHVSASFSDNVSDTEKAPVDETGSQKGVDSDGDEAVEENVTPPGSPHGESQAGTSTLTPGVGNLCAGSPSKKAKNSAQGSAEKDSVASKSLIFVDQPAVVSDTPENPKKRFSILCAGQRIVIQIQNPQSQLEPNLNFHLQYFETTLHHL